MKSKIFSFLKYSILFGIGVLLFWMALKDVDLASMYQKIKHANWIWVWISLVFSVLAFVSRAVRWNIMIEPSGYKPSVANTTYAVIIGYFANLAFPRLGEVTRCGTLSRKEKVPFDLLIGTVIVERTIDTLTLLIAMLVLLATQFKTMYGFLDSNVFSKFDYLFTVKYISISIIFLVLVVAVIFFVLRMKRFEPLIEKIKLLTKGIVTGLKSIAKIRKPGWFIFHSCFIWILYYLSTWMCFYAMPATSVLGWSEAVFVLVAGGFAMAAPVQGGIGTYEIFVANGLLLFSIPYDSGVAFALLVHFTQIIMIVVCGFFALLMLFLTKEKVNTEDKKIVDEIRG